MPKKILPTERKTHNNITTFSTGAALNKTGEEMYAPFLAYYAGNILGVTPEQYGFIEGIAEAINRILRGVTGILSNRWGRKSPIVLGYIFIALSRLGLSVVRGWAGFIPMRGLRQIGRSLCDPGREAAITESVPPQQRNKAFGVLNTVDTIGAVLGPIIGLFILYSAAAGHFNINFIFSVQSDFPRQIYPWLFMWASIPTILSGWIIWILLKETRQKELNVAHSLNGHRPLSDKIKLGLKLFITNIRVYFANKQLRYATFSHMALAISAVPMQMILFYVYSKESGLSATPYQGAILFVAYSIIHFLASYPARLIADKLGRFQSQLIANIICVIALFSLMLIKSPLLMLVPMILFGIFNSLWRTSRRSIVSDLAPVNARESTLGTFSMLYGITASLSPILAGFLWHQISPAVAFFILGSIGFVAMVFLIKAKP